MTKWVVGKIGGLILFLAVSSSALGAAHDGRDGAYQLLGDAYPGASYIGGTVSMLNGAVAGLAGLALGLDSKAPVDEVVVGWAGATVGLVVFSDGLLRVFGATSAQYVLPHYRNFPAGKPAAYGGQVDKAQYGREMLEFLASDAKRARLFRVAGDALLAGAYFYLFFKGPLRFDANGKDYGKDIYSKLIFPGSVVAGVAIYRLLFRSPEERALSVWREGKAAGNILGGPTVDFFAMVTPLKSVVGVAKIVF